MPDPKQFKNHEEYLQWYRNYRERNKEKFRKYNRKYNSEWRKEHKYSTDIKWNEENPEKRKASRLLQYAVRTKMIDRKPCAMCGKKNKIVGHHPDYSKPLEVIWLCGVHHSEIHRKRVPVDGAIDRLRRYDKMEAGC